MKRLAAVLSLALGITVIALGFALEMSRGARNALTGVGLVITVISGIELIGRLTKKPERAEKSNRPLPEYARKPAYMSRSEGLLFARLKEIEPNKYEVFPQAALVTVVDKLTQNSYRNELFRIVDFVIVDKVSFAPLLLVELNDSSHRRAERIERDRKVREICERARLPLVAFTIEESKDFGLVRKTVLRNILRK